MRYPGPMTPRIIAHRGDSDACPENTLAALARALEVGADVVELDVQLTADGHVVVIHDPTVDRTTNGSGAVRELALRELKGLSAGYPQRFGTDFAGERVPTLAEAFGLLRGRAKVIIEIKADTPGGDDGIEVQTLAEVHRAGMARDVALVSFSREVLQRCWELDAAIARGLTFVRAAPEAAVAAAAAVGADLLLPEKGMLSDELCARARDAGLQVGTWLVDDPAELPGLRRYDLAGLGSNRPGALIEALADAEP